jgi:hypothetical protein
MEKEIIELIIEEEEEETIKIVFEELSEVKTPLEEEELTKEELVIEEPLPLVEVIMIESKIHVVEEPVIKKNGLKLYQKVKYTPKLFGVIIEIKEKLNKRYYRVQFENSETSSWFKESNLKVETIADIKERLGFR